MNDAKIAILASTKSHFDHLVYQYRFKRDEVYYISDGHKLRGLPLHWIIMQAPDWWHGRNRNDCDLIEQELKIRESRLNDN